MMYLNDFLEELELRKRELLSNPHVKSDFSNVLVSVDIRDGKEYLTYHLEEDVQKRGWI